MAQPSPPPSGTLQALLQFAHNSQKLSKLEGGRVCSKEGQPFRKMPPLHEWKCLPLTQVLSKGQIVFLKRTNGSLSHHKKQLLCREDS